MDPTHIVPGGGWRPVTAHSDGWHSRVEPLTIFPSGMGECGVGYSWSCEIPLDDFMVPTHIVPGGGWRLVTARTAVDTQKSIGAT